MHRRQIFNYRSLILQRKQGILHCHYCLSLLEPLCLYFYLYYFLDEIILDIKYIRPAQGQPLYQFQFLWQRLPRLLLIFGHIFLGLKVVFLKMFFLIIVEVYNLRYDFSNFAISTSGRGRVNIFLILVSVLIQILIIFLLFLSFFVRGFATFVK